uniref:Tc1-like transposase DDE domain-containing protein n=1 Tax=Electrophorus electricus TaxID=8005 RepID=A0A4W4GLL2_ELEEL
MVQEDNGPSHCTRLVQEHSSVFAVRPWTATSPELNPVEHI